MSWQSKYTCAFTGTLFLEILSKDFYYKKKALLFSYSSSKVIASIFISYHFIFFLYLLRSITRMINVLFYFPFGGKMRKSPCASGPEVVGGQAKDRRRERERTHFVLLFPSFLFQVIIIIITKRNEKKVKEK